MYFFRKEIISHSTIKRLQACKAFWYASESTQIWATRVFFSFTILLQLWWPIESNISQVCYMYFICMLVFDNYQRCPVPAFNFNQREFKHQCMIPLPQSFKNNKISWMILKDPGKVVRFFWRKAPVKVTPMRFWKPQIASVRFHKTLGFILSLGQVCPNLGLILRFTCYSARLGLVLSPKINPKLGRVWWNQRLNHKEAPLNQTTCTREFGWLSMA